MKLLIQSLLLSEHTSLKGLGKEEEIIQTVQISIFRQPTSQTFLSVGVKTYSRQYRKILFPRLFHLVRSLLAAV